MKKGFMLTASAVPAIDIKASFNLTATADTKERSVGGTVVEYGEVGLTNAGKTKFIAGSIEVPTDLPRVKLLEMHDQERSVGHLARYTDTPERMVASYRVANGPAGDAAIEAVQQKTRDALSLGAEITGYHYEGDVLVVTAARLYETSLVTVPAFTNSRIDQIAATRKAEKLTEEEKRKLAEAQAKAAADETARAAVAAAGPAAPVVVQAAQTNPAPLAPPAAPAGDDMSLDQLARNIVAGFKANHAGVAGVMNVVAKANPPMFVNAALTDVVPADDPGLSTDVTRPKWLGELWQARRIDRPTIDSIGKLPLTSLKVHGYSITYPAATDVPAHLINKYDGAKAPVPASAKLKTAPKSEEAQRYAGGWDVDRAYFDFNDYGFIATTLRAAHDDYLAQTEAEAVAKLLAAATAVEGADVLEILSLLGAAAANLGSNLSKIQFGSDMWKQFTSLSTAEVPWWLQKQGSINLGTSEGNAGGLLFNTNPELAPGEVLANDKRAATHYETPLINVQAQHIANGGVDLGVFGYDLTMINDARAIFKGSTPVVP